MDELKIPARIQALADQAKGVPFAWRENDTQIVIVFVDGRKLTFEKVIENSLDETGSPNTEPVLPPSTTVDPPEGYAIPDPKVRPESAIRIPKSEIHKKGGRHA